jgi:glutaredoxin-related protein
MRQACNVQAAGELKSLLESKLVSLSKASKQPLTVSEPEASGKRTDGASAKPDACKEERIARLQTLVRQKPIMLFMKGSPGEPRCGFSRKARGVGRPCWPCPMSHMCWPLTCNTRDFTRVSHELPHFSVVFPGSLLLALTPTYLQVATALKAIDVQFGHFDILTDEEVRQGLKEYSNWPTYPQLYVNGELLGGCDIVLQMQEAGELLTTINEMRFRLGGDTD